MEIRKVQVTDMMAAREARAFRQQELIRKYEKNVICFTLNIAGPVKNSDLIQKTFEEGVTCIFNQLRVRGIAVLFFEKIHEATGNEAFIVVDCDNIEIKCIMSEIEDTHPLGRLFDIDVLAHDGIKMERGVVGLSERRCLICGGPVHRCSSRRVHPAEELQKKTFQMMEKYFFDNFIEKIASFAMKALLYEVSVSPKPGLVDRFNNGSHHDMDSYSFVDSSVALIPHFKSMIRIGIETAMETPEKTFRKLQYEGMNAESAMFNETQNVNTHKGAIFSIGIICGAIGRLKGKGGKLTAEQILGECGALSKTYAEFVFNHIEQQRPTAGCQLYKKYGIKGVRGEAADGFPTVLNTGLPILKKALAEGYTKDEAGSITLLYLLSEAVDTNIIARSDYPTYIDVKKQLNEILNKEKYPAAAIIRDLDHQFISKNLSPGGAADLLAICWFLYFIECDDGE